MKKYLLSLGVLFLCSCSSHLVYVHDSTVGLSFVPPSTNSSKAKFSFGYEQDTFTKVPKRDDGTSMSLVAASRVKTTGTKKIQFGHIIATGNVATDVAKNPQIISEAHEKLKVEQESK